MKILALDTSTQNFSLAVSENGKILAYKNKIVHKALSDSIVPSINGVLKKAKLSLNQLDGFAVGLGPGSFTSLRVGLSTVKAFCFATGKPVVGIPSLDIIAMNVVNEKASEVCVLCDARRNLLYACIYELKDKILMRKTPYLLIPAEDLLREVKEKTIFVGDGIKVCEGLLKRKRGIFTSEKKWYPQAKQLVSLAVDRFKKKQYDNINKLVPLYLYPEDCQVRKIR